MSDAGRSVGAAIDFEDVFESAPCGYLLADGDGRVVRANRTFADWIGSPPAELRGKRLPDLLTVPGKIFYETHLAPALRMAGSLKEIALELVTADRQKLSVLVSANESRTDDSPDIRFRYVFFVATERRGYERGLLRARDEAEASLVGERADSELREQFIAVLGHDLRNPLASINSGINILGKETLSDRGRKVTVLMAGSVLRAAGLIDNVLDFARGRLGGGITLIRDTRQPLEPMLRQVVAELRSTSPAREIAEHYALEEPIPCDHLRVGQLLSNLLGNALTHGARDQPIRVDAATSMGELVIAVSNGGTPIPPAALDKLFQPFFRGHDRVRQGLGLGLHIASEIAKAHGGTLVARSDDVATTFVFTMPLSIAEHVRGDRA